MDLYHSLKKQIDQKLKRLKIQNRLIWIMLFISIVLRIVQRFPKVGCLDFPHVIQSKMLFDKYSIVGWIPEPKMISFFLFLF